MATHSLMVWGLLLTLFSLPLAAQGGGQEKPRGLLERAGNMWKSSGAEKLVDDAGELARRVGREVEEKGVDELLDTYILRPAKGVMDDYNGKPVERVVNDFFGENEDDTGEPEKPEKPEDAEPPQGKVEEPPRVYAAQNKQDAINYVLRQSERCVSPIMLTCKGASKKFPGQLIRHVFAHGGASSASGMLENETVHLRFEYTDDARIKACHAGFLSKSKLNAAERRAYETALAVVQRVKKKHAHEYQQAVALHDYLVLNSRYDRTKLRKLKGAATTLLLDGRGVCNAYMRSYSILLNIAGIENEYITGGRHGWNMVKLENEWTHVDVTWDDPVPDQKGRLLHIWFGMTDKQIRKSHRWNRSVYTRKATNEALYYPTRQKD